MVIDFNFINTPQIIFGSGKIKKLPQFVKKYGENTLLLIGGNSLQKSGYYRKIISYFNKSSITVQTIKVTDEPSPDLVDEITKKYRNKNIEIIIAIGGGSVLDTGKAVSAMLSCNDPVMEYLEGVGAGKIHSGEKIPFIAVPTTSGTGSEATKNAVLSRVGKNGFKKSLRHDNFVPDIALLDPALTISCPPEITAASGLDALTQLMGAYTSTTSFLLTDSLSVTALGYIGKCLIPACTNKQNDIAIRSGMAYASLISGITLANAGLGIVHGFASSIGGCFEIPHGIICGTLLGEATKINIKLLKENGNLEYLKKYAKAARILKGKENLTFTQKEIYINCDLLVDLFQEWIEKLNIPRLGKYGVTEDDLEEIVLKTSNKNNPVQLNNKQKKEILINRL